MDQTNHSFMTEPIGFNCIALYKITKKHNLPLPQPKIQYYLAGVIDRVSDSSKQNTFSAFVVGTIEELEKVVLKYEIDSQPNAVPSLVAQLSGDFSLNYNAHFHNEDSEFPAVCYSVAQYHYTRMGRETEAQVLGLLALNLPDYLNLLSSYYQELRDNPEFVITDEDYLEFKKEFQEAEQKPLIVLPPKIKNKTSGRLLI